MWQEKTGKNNYGFLIERVFFLDKTFLQGKNRKNTLVYFNDYQIKRVFWQFDNGILQKELQTFVDMIVVLPSSVTC